MKTFFLITTAIFFLFLFSGCPSTKPTKYNQGVFPEIPVNFIDVNSIYDDYNSMLPIIQHAQYLCFSSNRNSNGQNFDIVGDNLNILWDMETGMLTVNDKQSFGDITYIDTILQMINTVDNEFGPNALNYWMPVGMYDSQRFDLVTYSSNYESNYYKSKFVYHISDGNGNGDGSYYGPYDINIISSLENAQYISFLRDEVYNSRYWEVDPRQFTKMIFNASADSITNIYSVDLPPNDDFIEMLKSDTAISPVSIAELNSIGDDKCPFVNNHFMVFTSNRAGGFGGYDLYYSWYENGIWSAPVNFGADINTEYDEFRPVTIEVYDFVNDLMIFSSNRPGGKGGFDLYYVGLPFKLNNYPILIEK